MRGRVRKAAAARKVRVIQRPGRSCHSAMGEASMRASMSPTPPPIPQTTNTPTAISASSFTSASAAIAITTP